MKPAPAPRPQGTRQSPRLAINPPAVPAPYRAAGTSIPTATGARPPPYPRTTQYRAEADQRQCVADTVLTYHNANSMAAQGAGRAYLRDVAIPMSDVHAISETGWDAGQIKVLAEAMEADGHRLWAVAAETRSTAKSGTAILVRATVAPRPGDGPLWAKPDGKALAVAITIQDRPVVLLAVHLPHKNPLRVEFLTEVADEVERAVDAHSQTAAGAPWLHPLYLWAGDLNLTNHPTLDNEKWRPAPPPDVAQALCRLNQVMGGAQDVYRTLHPQGRAYTHGAPQKPGSGRRLDAWFAQADALTGPKGVVSARLVTRESAGFSYLHTHTRKEEHKESDHHAVQIILRATAIPKPKPRSTLQLDTLTNPAVRAAMKQLLAEDGLHTPDTADTLWERILEVGIAHQRRRAQERGALRSETLKTLKRLHEKLRVLPQGRAHKRVSSTLLRYKAKLQRINHRARRERDSREDYAEQMVASGQGKRAKPWAPSQPITSIREPATCRVQAALRLSPGGHVQLRLATNVADSPALSSQEDITASVSAFWEDLLNAVHTPSEQAERDKAGVLGQIKAETKLLPEAVAEGLKTANLIGTPNVAEAIKSLSRGSTPGEDDMGLDFFLEHIDDVAPILSTLYARILEGGRMTPTMCHAVLSPLYKDKGSKTDRAMYRPISVTTIPYRIFAKCIAQKLNTAIPTLLGDPQTGYCTGRSYDENVRIVRQTAHDINNNRPADGGVMLMLDNAKAFDRLQHGFMLEVLEAFNIPPDVIKAVKTLYTGAETRVKVNGQLGAPFPNTSGVKQGCPLSGILYILVQEVQLRMIRSDPAIRGIPIPGPDGALASPAARLASKGDSLTDRGLVDDTMVALATRDSIPPLLRVLDRFEAMSNHRMNISKTMMLLLGDERNFDLAADSPAALALRRRGLTRTYDITTDVDDRLPDKWHGIVMGNEAGITSAWEGTIREAGEMAESLHACPMPHGSRARVGLAQSKIMGKAFATLRLTAPNSQDAIDTCLGDLQKHADRLVFGRWWLTAEAAAQPRSALGVGHLHVAKYMQAAWVQPLLSSMGRDQHRRPFKHYYARYAREAYPALGMGRELLSLNLGFARAVALPPEAMPGEARQAFKALGELPALRYLPPGAENPECTPREDIPYEDLVQLPLLFNPMLDDRPAEHRATPAQEGEVLRWATHGVSRVAHILHPGGRRVLTLAELRARTPALVGRGITQARVTSILKTVHENLHRWKSTLATGPSPTVQAGHFRHTTAGQVLLARRSGTLDGAPVPAWVCEVEPQTGSIRTTREAAALPSASADSGPCPAICLYCSEPEVTDDEETVADHTGEKDTEHEAGDHHTPASVLDAKERAFTHAALGPRDAPPVPDPRMLEWVMPDTSRTGPHVTLAYSTTRQVRQTLLAQAWVEPRSFTTRYAPLLAGLSSAERRSRLAQIAEAVAHPVIPERERHHLYVTMHHGHWQGAKKCKGDHALCARCLQGGARHEETVAHVVHDCPTAREVWPAIAKAWEAATTEPLDTSSQSVTVLGLRPKPPAGATTQDRDRHRAREPAWRLLHAVTLLKLHQARTRAHMAHHDPKGS